MTSIRAALVVLLFLVLIIDATPARAQIGPSITIDDQARQSVRAVTDRVAAALPRFEDSHAVSAIAPTTAVTPSAQAAPRVLPATGGSDPLASLGGFDGLWVLLALGIAFLLLGSLSYLPHPPRRSQKR
jgi:hypothetical protein